MGTKLFLFWTGLLAAVCGSVSENSNNGFSTKDGGFYTDDAVVLNAAVSRIRRDAQNNTRDGKQLFLFQTRTVDEGAFGQDCQTTLGKKGTCKEFRECYPLIKVSLTGGDGWVMGHYDTCSYISGDNMEVFGVCCTEPVGTPPQQEPDVQRLGVLPPAVPMQLPPQLSGFHGGILSALSPQWTFGNSINFRQIPPGWPPAIPPLPTHPPDHTAPTHPPSLIAGVTKPPTSTMATTWATRPQMTTRPTTKQTWPPMYPTQPSRPTAPTQAPRPTAPPAAVGGSCGNKNAKSIETDDERIVGGHNAELNEWPWIVALFNGGRQFCGGSLIDDRHVLSAAHCVAHQDTDDERIVGGHNAELNERPWIVALFNGGRQFCGGSLIDDTHVLSAAHCVAHMTSWDVARLTARLGDHNIHTNSETRHIERKIKRVVRHRGFDMRTLYNDIAILTLDQPVTFTKNIKPVCLPGGGQLYTGQTATVIGWGSLRESGPQPATLQEVTIPIWSNSDCRLKYGGAAPGGIVDHMLCAGRANMDSCSGDSGGPLMVPEGGRWTQVGVVSWGIGCGKGQYPGVYTRVTAFLPWIQKNSK